MNLNPSFNITYKHIFRQSNSLTIVNKHKKSLNIISLTTLYLKINKININTVFINIAEALSKAIAHIKNALCNYTTHCLKTIKICIGILITTYDTYNV